MSDSTHETLVLMMSVYLPSDTKHLSSDGSDTILNGTTYKQESIEISEIKSNADGKSNPGNFSFTIQSDSELGIALLKTNKQVLQEEGKVYMDFNLFNSNDQLDRRLLRVMGWIENVDKRDKKIVVFCTSLARKLKAEALSRVYSNTCAYTIYDYQCGANELSTSLPVGGSKVYNAGLSNVSVIQVNSSSFIDSMYSNTEQREALSIGILKWYDPKVDTYRKSSILGVEKISGKYYFTVTPSIPNRAIAFQFIAISGCNLTFRHCHMVHNNIRNFGGFPYMTGGKNPFSDAVLDS